MPWSETTPMEQRQRFMDDYLSGKYTVTELAEAYGVSRKTAYKWIHRFAKEGDEGLKDRSRRPKSCPHQTSKEVEKALLDSRRHRPSWGPRKLLPVLRKQRPEVAWPAASTVGAVLKRHGLVTGRQPRRRWAHPGRPTTSATAPNQVWTSDFKGEFLTGDHRYCYPLTVADGFSRYLLAVDGLASVAGDGVWPVFERLFREYGLPQVIRTDNGPPFASKAVAGLSRLSVRWIKLGIQPERIQPGRPQQNGQHERMHRTLKAETTRPPAANQIAQQRCFDQFRCCYNEQRPHEALDFRTPSELYTPSPRPYPSRIPQPEYPGHFQVRFVHQGGEIRWRGQYLFVSECLGGEHIGLEEYEDGVWSVYFGQMLLARLDDRERRLYGP